MPKQIILVATQSSGQAARRPSLGRELGATGQRREAGFVSLFTVIFFMLLISVIGLSFLRISLNEQRQSIDNDLSASAFAAAESGVEDAKRALIKYASLPDGNPLKNDLQAAFTSSSCTAIFDSASIRTALDISNEGSITGSPELPQSYTCLDVNLEGQDYIGQSSAGKSEFIPLRPQSGDFDRIRISWHMTSGGADENGDGPVTAYALGTQLPPVNGGANSWSTRGYPAYMRAQLYGFPNGSFSRDQAGERSRSIFLAPNSSSNAAAQAAGTPIAMSAVDPLPHDFDQGKTGVRGIRCTGNPPGTPVSSGTYACTATLELPNEPGLRGNNNNYYLRLTPQYGATHFRVQMLNGGTVVPFNGVQPIIDSTGRTNDVFRRVLTRVRLDNLVNLPEYAVESADTICKNMQVSDGSYYQPNNCP